MLQLKSENIENLLAALLSMVYCTYDENFFLSVKRITVRHPADITTIARSSPTLLKRF